MNQAKIKTSIPYLLGAVVFAAVAYFVWQSQQEGDYAGFAKGNGRIEATEIDLSAKIGGNVEDIFVKEGDFVKAGQVLAKIKAHALEAQLKEAKAQLEQANNAVLTTQAQVQMGKSDKQAAIASVAQRNTELDAAKRRVARSEVLAKEGAASKQQLDDDRASVQAAVATLAAARAQVDTAEASIKAVEAQVVGAKSNVNAVQATIERIEAELSDTEIVAPRDGRIQYLVAQKGETVASGGKIMNVVDLSDVFMTFFLPETVAGKVPVGTDVRLVLDALPTYAIPAKVSHVADTAQFTPKTVETESERQKLMFKVKAKIPPELLQQHLQLVKTGLPGVAWVRLDAKQDWPTGITKKAE